MFKATRIVLILRNSSFIIPISTDKTTKTIYQKTRYSNHAASLTIFGMILVNPYCTHLAL